MYYTKYRPQKFSEISRPNEAADALVKQVLSGKTAHAYLFVGPRGTGKTSTARILSKALNCVNLSKNGDPCGECPSCESIRRGSYLDLNEIDAASNRGIDDIRELKNKVRLAPTLGERKIYIIDEVHMLTTEAFNALLKTLEEPPERTTFVLCTTEFHKVPETIKSRCQVFKFRRATIRQITTKLENICEQEALSIEKSDLEKIARASLGGFRDAETMLQQIAEGEVTVESVLNVGSKEKYLEFCELIFNKDSQFALKSVNKVFDEGGDLYVWCGELVKHMRELLMLKSGVSSDMIDVPDELVTAMKKQAVDYPLMWLINTLEIFAEAQQKIKNSFIPQLPLEISIVKICNEGSITTQAESKHPPDSDGTGFLRLKSKVVVDSVKDVPETAPIKNEPADNSVQIEQTEEELIEFDEGDEGVIEFSIIEQKWTEVIVKIEGINRSILGLLRAGKPVAIDGRFLTLEVGYSFHKERLEAPKNREVLEKVLDEIFNSKIKIRCKVTDEKPKSLRSKEVGVLTDYNIAPITKEAVIDMLDGGLPL
jgi:DNA polymerase-3 subunit gamma/tau